MYYGYLTNDIESQGNAQLIQSKLVPGARVSVEIVEESPPLVQNAWQQTQKMLRREPGIESLP